MRNVIFALLLSLISLSCHTQKASLPTMKKNCPEPLSLRGSIISETSLLLRWNKNCDLSEGYRIQRKSSGEWETIVDQDKDASFYFDEGLDLNKEKYQYRIAHLGHEYSEIYIAPDVPKDMNDIYPYLIHFPDSYENSGKAFPLMIFLHGAGERGANLSMLEVHGPPKLIKEGKGFPCIVISPQCPENVYWQTNRLEKVLDEVSSKYRIDLKRIYLTGLSMGGYGTWEWAAQFPDKFAAIAPICGGGNTDNARKLKKIPTWVFHGAKDRVVALSESQSMVDALIAIGGEPKFTIYPEAYHDSWTESYNNQSLFDWMFAQKLE